MSPHSGPLTPSKSTELSEGGVMGGDGARRSFHAAEGTLEGSESLHMMRKGQVKRLGGRDTSGQASFVASLFGVAA